MTIEASIRRKLEENFQPIQIEILNESHLHAGHHSSPGTGESHFRVLMVAQDFEGKSRIERHRMVNMVLADELAGCVHALALKILAPSEVKA